MNKKERQLQYEKVWAQPFIDYINSKHQTDYLLAEHDNATTFHCPDIDVAAKSQSDTFPTLYLQLTVDSRLAEVLKIDGHKLPIFNSDNVFKAIDDKAKKYLRNKKDFSKIILLIQGNMNKRSCDLTFIPSYINQCRRYPFKAIYYLSPPKVWGPEGVSNFEDWFVIDIKPIEKIKKSM